MRREKLSSVMPNSQSYLDSRVRKKSIDGSGLGTILTAGDI